MYKKIRDLVKKNKTLEVILKYFINIKRIKLAQIYLKESNVYPNDFDKIINDYSYSIKKDHRGIRQVLNIEIALRFIEGNNVEGCFVETGTFTGGASAYALLAMQRLTPNGKLRNYWGFDSFEGMPAPSVEDGDQGFVWLYGRNIESSDFHKKNKLIGHDANRADYHECYEYLSKTGYPKHKLNLVKGWFQETIPAQKKQISKIAILRLDGDFYDSTMIVLNELYSQVSPNGIVIIDDYGSFAGCRKAVDSFLEKEKIQNRLLYIENGIRMLVKS